MLKELSNKGNTLYDQGKYDEALLIFNRCLSIDSSNTEIINKKNKCEKVLEEERKKKVEEFVKKGKEFASNKKYEEAIKCFDEALKIRPNDSQILTYKGISLKKLKKYEEAIKYFDEALKIDVKYKDALREKNECNRLITERDKAIQAEKEKRQAEERKRQAEERKRQAEELFKEGLNLFFNSQYEEALEKFDEVITLDPENYLSWVNKGQCLSLLEKYDEAIECYDKAIEIDSNKLEAFRCKDSTITAQNKAIIKSQDWNTSESDITKNDNLFKAISVFNKLSPEYIERASEYTSLLQVKKASWKYYGKVLNIQGSVTSITDFPPGGDESNNIADGGECSEIKVMTNDNIFIGILLIGRSGELQEGTNINCNGILIGEAKGTNAFGGTVSNMYFVVKGNFE